MTVNMAKPPFQEQEQQGRTAVICDNDGLFHSYSLRLSREQEAASAMIIIVASCTSLDRGLDVMMPWRPKKRNDMLAASPLFRRAGRYRMYFAWVQPKNHEAALRCAPKYVSIHLRVAMLARLAMPAHCAHKARGVTRESGHIR